MEEEKTKVSVRLSKEEAKRIKTMAAANNRSISAEVLTAVQWYIVRYGAPNGNPS